MNERESTPYDARRERMARLLAASLMGLVKDPTGDRLPDECWRQLLPKADSVLFITSPPGTQEHHLAGRRLEDQTMRSTSGGKCQ